MSKPLPRFDVTVRQRERGIKDPHILVGQIHFIGLPARSARVAANKAVKIAKQMGLTVVVDYWAKSL